MVEKVRKQPIRWTVFVSRVVALRLALGQSQVEIAKAVDCDTTTLRKHIRDEGLDVDLSERARLALAEAVEAERVLIDLQMVKPGSLAQARLRLSLKDMRKIADQRGDAEESDMQRTKTIGEMSDDELRDYVASLVPGLEIKSGRGSFARDVGDDGAVSVSDDGETGSETAKPGDELA